MNNEIKKKAMDKLSQDYPGEIEIFRRWERCIEMYTSGYCSIPESIEKILEKIGLEQHFNEKLTGELKAGLQVVNSAISHGASKELIHDALYNVYSPQYYALMELLWSLNPQSEAQRLDVAKQDFLQQDRRNSPECDMRYYGVDNATLGAWTVEAPDVPPAPNSPLRPAAELRTEAIELLTERLPDEQCAFHDVDEGLEFYDLGCQDAIRKIIKKWIDEHYTDEVRELLMPVNAAIMVGQPVDRIREKLLPAFLLFFS